MPKETLAQHAGREAENIRVVVASAHLGRHVVVAKNGANAKDLVGGDAHPQARAANQDASIRFSPPHLPSNGSSDVGIVNRSVVADPQIDDLVTGLPEQLDQHLSHLITVMIGTNGDKHRYTSTLVSGR